jgi:hypothetical protein
LLEAFVRVNRWDLLEDVLGRLYRWRLDLSLHRGLLAALTEALEWAIEPVYKEALSKQSSFFKVQVKRMNKSGIITEAFYSESDLKEDGHHERLR